MALRLNTSEETEISYIRRFCFAFWNFASANFYKDVFHFDNKFKRYAERIMSMELNRSRAPAQQRDFPAHALENCVLKRTAESTPRRNRPVKDSAKFVDRNTQSAERLVEGLGVVVPVAWRFDLSSAEVENHADWSDGKRQAKRLARRAQGAAFSVLAIRVREHDRRRDRKAVSCYAICISACSDAFRYVLQGGTG